MNKWNLNSASAISKDDFDIFNRCFPNKILYFDDLIETIKYLSTSVVTTNFYIISTSQKHFLFINCDKGDYKKNHERIMDITKNKYKLLLLKNRIRDSFSFSS